MASFRRECCPFVALYLDWKVQRFCWPKGTSLECAKSIYVKTTGCGSEEVAMPLEGEGEGEEEEFGGFENVLRDAEKEKEKSLEALKMYCVMRAIPIIYIYNVLI